MDWQDKRVLVTGGAGFIGSHLAETLVKSGANVTIADNFSRGKPENIKNIENEITLYKLDLTLPKNCLTVTKDIDIVFHLAASVGGIHYILRENVGGLTPSLLMNTNMLEATRQHDVKQFLFASSACIYRGKETGLNRFKEEDAYPANPLTTYGWAKLLGEIECIAYHKDYGIKTSSARIFNAYGPREDLDPKWSHVIPSLVRKAILHPLEEYRIFGDGTQERAFIYVQDCVNGLIHLLEKINDGTPVNLGSEEVVSINDVAHMISAISGKSLTLKHDLSGPLGTYKYCADTTNMIKILEWIPSTTLEEGLERVFTWARRKLNAKE